MSAARAGSGKGEGPRDTAGRSNYQCKQEAEHEKEENRGGWGAKKSISVVGIMRQHRQKAATRTIHNFPRELHAQESNHYGGEPRHVGGKKQLTEEQRHRNQKRWRCSTHRETISTLVPAPKRSTLGVVAALDSVVGLCSGIESNISKNKDTQSYFHSDSKSSA